MRRNVPFFEPRSVSSMPASPNDTCAWCPLMNGSSGKLMSFPSRPIDTMSPVARNTSPEAPPGGLRTRASGGRPPRRREHVRAVVVGPEPGGLGRRRLDAKPLLADEEHVARLQQHRATDADVHAVGAPQVGDDEL